MLLLLRKERTLYIRATELLVKGYSRHLIPVPRADHGHQFDIIKASLTALQLVVDRFAQSLLVKGVLFAQIIAIHTIELLQVDLDDTLDGSALEESFDLLAIRLL